MVPSIKMQSDMRPFLQSVQLQVTDHGEYGQTTTALVQFRLVAPSQFTDQEPESISLLETVELDGNDLNRAATSARKALSKKLHQLAGWLTNCRTTLPWSHCPGAPSAEIDYDS